MRHTIRWWLRSTILGSRCAVAVLGRSAIHDDQNLSGNVWGEESLFPCTKQQLTEARALSVVIVKQRS